MYFHARGVEEGSEGLNHLVWLNYKDWPLFDVPE